MMRSAPTLKSSLLVVIAASAFSQASFASTILDLNYTATYDGSSIVNNVANSIINTPPATSVSTYTHTLPTLLNTIPGSINAINNPNGSEFYDDYVFTIGGSNLSAITATIDLGTVFQITDLNARLFSWNGTTEQSSQTVTIGPVATLYQAWTQAVGSGEVAVINQTGLAAGTYVLQIRGNVSGSSGGTYVGQLQVTPVPLPAALPLLISGLGLLSGAIRRRRITD